MENMPELNKLSKEEILEESLEWAITISIIKSLILNKLIENDLGTEESLKDIINSKSNIYFRLNKEKMKDENSFNEFINKKTDQIIGEIKKNMEYQT